MNVADITAELPAVWQVPGYTHHRLLGAGATGQVQLAIHDETGTPVAIKYLSPKLGGDPEWRAGFRAEAALLAEVDNPHVARFYEYVESPVSAAIVMELVDGVSLRELLRSQGPTDPETALFVLKGSLLGLAAAHERGVVHRDYKPENVLVMPTGESKLADFGIASHIGTEVDLSGTPGYMAPEQWRGEAPKPATDIYAATATFFECLTGRQPYAGTADLTELQALHEYADIPTEFAPPEVQGLLRHGMAKRAELRPSSAAEFLELLESVAVAAYGAGWEDDGRRKLIRRIALLLALLPSALAPEIWPEVTSSLGKGLRVSRKLVAVGTAAVVVVLGAVGIGLVGSGNGNTPIALPNSASSPSIGTESTPSGGGGGTANPSASTPAEPAASPPAGQSPTDSPTSPTTTTSPTSSPNPFPVNVLAVNIQRDKTGWRPILVPCNLNPKYLQVAFVITASGNGPITVHISYRVFNTLALNQTAVIDAKSDSQVVRYPSFAQAPAYLFSKVKPQQKISVTVSTVPPGKQGPTDSTAVGMHC